MEPERTHLQSAAQAPPTVLAGELAALDTLPPATRAPFRLARALRHRSLLVGTILCLLILVLISAAPLLTSANPDDQNPLAVFAHPSSEHLMGADSFGRDMVARVLYGGRATVLASVAVVVLGSVVGSTLGIIAGYFGGPLGMVIMRFVDLLLAFPGILLALAVAAILGPGLVNGVVAVAIVSVPVYARVVEGATIEIRHLPYVDAAITLGAGAPHVLRRHILPNVLSGIVVLATSWLGVAALWIAALGFIGLGVQPPTPEWGAILNDGQNYITIAWWIAFFPGTFLALWVVAVNLIGDGLRDELDPTLARR
jgi:ABC-type dipeptide/oligopeptide/nickel transport system permease subunit